MNCSRHCGRIGRRRDITRDRLPTRLDLENPPALLQVMPYRDGPEARAELTVRAEEFQMLAEAVPHMVYRCSPDGSVVGYMSPTVRDIRGVDAADVAFVASAFELLSHHLPTGLPVAARMVAAGRDACTAAPLAQG